MSGLDAPVLRYVSRRRLAATHSLRLVCELAFHIDDCSPYSEAEEACNPDCSAESGWGYKVLIGQLSRSNEQGKARSGAGPGCKFEAPCFARQSFAKRPRECGTDAFFENEFYKFFDHCWPVSGK